MPLEEVPGGGDGDVNAGAKVLIATPIDLRRVLRLDKPALRVGYELQEIGKPDLEDALRPLFPS